MKKIDWKTCFRVGLSVFLLYMAIHYWPSISNFLGKLISAAAPIFIGFAVAYVVNILMSFYERHFFPRSQKKGIIKARRGVCLVGAIITGLGIIAVVGILVIPQLVQCIMLLVNELPGAIEKVIAKLNSFSFVSDELISELTSIDWKSRISDVAKSLTSGFGDVVNVAFSAVSSVFTSIVNFVIGFIFSLYLLSSKEKLSGQYRNLIRHYVPVKISDRLFHVLAVADSCFHRFIVGQCTEAVLLGTLCMLGMLIFRLPYAPMIGALMAFTALIPIVGGLLGAGIGAFLILMESPIKALVFLIFIIILQQLEGNLIYPKVVGSSIGLPAIWVLAAVTVGGSVMGIGGMLIGVPLAATVYKLVKEDVDKREKKLAEAQKSEQPEESTEE